MPLTRRGWAVLGGSMALTTAGRALGVIELFVLAAGGAAMVVAAVISVLLRRRMSLEGTRRLVPSRVHAGTDSRVELLVRNTGDQATPVLTLRDAVVPAAPRSTAPARQARFHIAPLLPSASDRAAYRLGAERRGVFRIGPMEVVVADPFGLASSSSQAAPVTDLTVYPPVESVVPPPFTSGHDPRSGGGHSSALGSGDEFYGLRAYEVGDDLRQVHWPSTARQDDLMIRQQELAWQGRATVVLDSRATAHTEESLDQAVSIAASLLTASWRRDSHVRLLTTDGMDSGFGGGPTHLEAVMEHLAVVQAGNGSLDSLAGALRRRATGALVVVTTTAAPNSSLDRLTAASNGFGWVGLVLVDPSARGSTGGAPSAGPGGLTVRVGLGQPFAPAWNAALATGSAWRSSNGPASARLRP